MSTVGVLNDTISEMENDVLEWLREDRNRTTAELAVISGKSQRTITRAMAGLKGKGLIERVGSKKAGYWRVR